jgi:hypothetical protein
MSADNSSANPGDVFRGPGPGLSLSQNKISRSNRIHYNKQKHLLPSTPQTKRSTISIIRK